MSNTLSSPRARWLIPAALALLALSVMPTASGCRCVARAVINDEREEQLGASVDSSMRRSNRMLSDTHAVSVWAADFVDTLVEASRPFRAPDGFGGYKVAVIDDDGLINAFAAPGGFVYLTTGFLLEVSSCDELAGVVGHELAHVTQRHGINAIADRIAVVGSLAVVGGLIGVNIPIDLASALISNSFSRKQEAEADRVGARIAHQAGYSPHGVLDFFDGLSEGNGSHPRALTFLSTHPHPANRSSQLRAYIQEHLPGAPGPDAERPDSCPPELKHLTEIQDLLRRR